MIFLTRLVNQMNNVEMGPLCACGARAVVILRGATSLLSMCNKCAFPESDDGLTAEFGGALSHLNEDKEVNT